MFNNPIKKQMLDLVSKQIKSNTPPFVKEAFLQLQQQGITKKQAKEMIALVLLGLTYDVLSEDKPFDEREYELELNELVAEEVVYDDIRQPLMDESGILLQAKHKIYDALEEDRPTEATRLFMEVWDDIKKYVIDNYYKQDTKGNLIKPDIIDIDDKTDFKYELFNWLQDMEMEFHNSRLYEERILFCQDVIELFAWNEDSADNYRTGIGEALNDLKRYKECDEWFENWMKEEPGNVSCINMYIDCAMKRKDLDKAKELIEQYVNDSLEDNYFNEILFYRAIEVYEELGDLEKIKKYQDKIDRCQEWFEDNMKLYNEDFPIPMVHQETIVKDKKIYPNDPCSCGSGKKYKKCCGRN